MAYMPEPYYCTVCKVYLGPDDGDGICGGCAQEAYDNAPEIPINEERIAEIVEYATKDRQEDGEVSGGRDVQGRRVRGAGGA